MMKRQLSFDYKDIGSLRFQFVLILTVLACVPPARAQTLNSSQVDNSSSSSNLSGLVNGKRGGSGFGAVDAGVSAAVNASLLAYSGSVDTNANSEFTGGLAGSGLGGKTSADAQKLLAGGSVPSTLSHEIQGARSRGFRNSGGLSLSSAIAYPALAGAVTQKLIAADALSKMMQSGSPTGAEEPESEGRLAAESDPASAMETITSLNGLEGLGESFKESLGASFESLCGQGCGQRGNSSPAEVRRNPENSEQALAHHLSRSATRLSLPNLASGGNSGRFSGRLPARESKLPGGSWSATQLSVGGGSNDQR
jgi:hypothetical protein